MKPPLGEKMQKLYKFFERYILFVVVIVVGALIVFWPGGDKDGGETGDGVEYPSFSVEELEAKLTQALGRVEGAGRVSVVLTLKSDMEVVLAKDTETRQSRETEGGESLRNESEHSVQTVIVGSSSDAAPFVTQRIYPLFRGALVICDGARSATVKLAVTEAVTALTGLGSDAISVLAMEP